MQHSQTKAPRFVLLAALLGCRSEPENPAAGARARAARAPAPSAAEAELALEKKTKAKADRTHRAARCGECHDKMYQEWSASPHARTNDGKLYDALRRTSADASCDRCHEPLIDLGGAPEFTRTEDVSCEVCHRMTSVTVHARFAEAPLERGHAIKYGPRCDVVAPDFHAAECRPMFQRSEMCAACHFLTQARPDGAALPVHSEYPDWKAGPYAAQGRTCQSCHMRPGVRAEIAMGEIERDDVPDHGFWGREASLRGTALSADVEVTAGPGPAAVQVTVKNARAGHAIPAGSPGRQLVLRVAALDANGADLSREDRVFQRSLVDADGKVAPFFAATRVGSDTRLAPLEVRRERFEIATPGAREARVTLLRRVDPELTARLGVEPSPEKRVAEVLLPLRTADGSRVRSSRPTAMLP